MFTGIIEEVGCIEAIEISDGTHRMTVTAPKLCKGLRLGDSVAVSGVCLTAVDISEHGFTADLAEETWRRTSFSRISAGATVNLELPLKAESRLGGHMVQGHVDGLGTLLAFEQIPGAKDYWLHIRIPQELEKYLVFKGSIAIEGISLTVAKLVGNELTIAIIPHTYEATNLASLKPGDPINIEADIAAKYLEKWTARTPEEQMCPPVGPSSDGCFAIVVSRFNSLITERLLAGALDTLKSNGIARSRIEIAHVPGAYEIPVVASLLAKTGKFDAVICIGCLIRGETLHYEVIANEAARGIGQSALNSGVPHTFGVVTCDTVEQALNRAGLKEGNKGAEAAAAALELARYTRQLYLQ